jgi:Zn-finger nucleic acid-binding protein
VAQHLIQAIRSRWWGLFTCYRVPGLPPTNNDQETFFNHLKQGQRRISGRKSVHEFVMRYGAYAAYIDPSETFDQLLERLRRVNDAEFQSARQSWRENESPLHKTHRFRHHRAKFLKELEADWEKLA